MDCPTTLVDAATLASHLDDPRWIAVDCRFSLADAGAGERAYAEGHIPAARYAHLEQALSAPVSPLTGRHPLPDPGALAAIFGLWGMDEGTRVVAYDDAGGAFAARLWWLLRWLGHPCVAVLDGGLFAWNEGGYPMSTAVLAPEPRTFPIRTTLATGVGADVLQAGLADDSLILVDARAAERYRGEQEPIDPVAGHVPGALNRPFNLNLDATGRFLPPEALRRAFQTLTPASAERIVHMCGSGVTACHNLLAMEHAGLTGSKLYPGSWSEWIRDPARPVARD